MHVLETLATTILTTLCSSSTSSLFWSPAFFCFFYCFTILFTILHVPVYHYRLIDNDDFYGKRTEFIWLSRAHTENSWTGLRGISCAQHAQQNGRRATAGHSWPNVALLHTPYVRKGLKSYFIVFNDTYFISPNNQGRFSIDPMGRERSDNLVDKPPLDDNRNKIVWLYSHCSYARKLLSFPRIIK